MLHRDVLPALPAATTSTFAANRSDEVSTGAAHEPGRGPGDDHRVHRVGKRTLAPDGYIMAGGRCDQSGDPLACFLEPAQRGRLVQQLAGRIAGAREAWCAVKLKIVLALGWLLAIAAGAGWLLERRVDRGPVVDEQRWKAVRSFCEGKASELLLVLRAFDAGASHGRDVARGYFRERANIGDAHREMLTICAIRPVAELPDLLACKSVPRPAAELPHVDGDVDWDWACVVERGKQLVHAIDPERRVP